MESLSPIQQFYKEKTIFITGGSGFMGKVLIEKLLYSCSNLEKIYILIRPKHGKSVETRINDMFNLPMFSRIKKANPEVLKKLVPLSGDVSAHNLGLSKDDEKILKTQVNIVFHCAATLRLEANLKDATKINTVGTKNILTVAKDIKNLKAFIHLSTAFCYVDQPELAETIYDTPDDPNEVIKLVDWLKDNVLDSITPSLIEPHPNTYTYTKRLAEKLVAAEFPNIRCGIARPSIEIKRTKGRKTILRAASSEEKRHRFMVSDSENQNLYFAVTPAWTEPLPGWVDNLNGPVGLIVGAGKGVIRSLHCNANYHAEVIPVDLAINSLIAIAYKIGTNTEKLTSIPVYNITQSGVMPITWGEVLEKGKSVAYDYPFENAIWYPDGDIRSSKFIHNLFVFFFHIIPAYFIDLMMLIFHQKRFMIRIQKRISDGLEVLQYFTTREWIFHNTNILVLWKDMSQTDKLLFPINFLNINEMEYIKNVILGARQYCMKEKLTTLQKARRHQKMLYVIHIFTVYMFYFTVIYFILNKIEFTRPLLNYATKITLF